MSKYAFITGATSGIGLATAKALAAGGYDLALAARNEGKLSSVKADIEKEFSVKVTPYVLDVREPEEIRKTVAACLAETKEEDILQMIDTNIKGLFLVTRAFLPSMLERNSGHIVNLGSTAGLYAYAGAAVYCSTKAAVKTFSDGIRIDVIDSDIKVTTIQPGIVHTPFSEVRFHGDKKRAEAVYEGVDALHAEDIADIIAFAVSRPKRVQISDIVIMANQQATGFMVSKKKKQ